LIMIPSHGNPPLTHKTYFSCNAIT